MTWGTKEYYAELAKQNMDESLVKYGEFHKQIGYMLWWAQRHGHLSQEEPEGFVANAIKHLEVEYERDSSDILTHLKIAHPYTFMKTVWVYEVIDGIIWSEYPVDILGKL